MRFLRAKLRRVLPTRARGSQILLQSARQRLKLLQGQRPQLLLLADGHAEKALQHSDRFDLAFDLAFAPAFALGGADFPFPVLNRSLARIIHGFVLGNLGNPDQRFCRLPYRRLRKQLQKCRRFVLVGVQEPVQPAVQHASRAQLRLFDIIPPQFQRVKLQRSRQDPPRFGVS